MTLPSLAHMLPHWACRTVKVGAGDVGVLVLVDGTLVVGFESSGADVFSADNARLNRNAGGIRRGLNALPPDAFLQAEWHTGLSSGPLIDAYERRGQTSMDAHARVLIEQRRERARALREDPSIVAGRIVYFVGQRWALGRLGPHRGGALSRLFSTRKDPQTITPADFNAAVTALAETAARVREELAATGSTLRPLDARGLLAECHRALNPLTSLSLPLVPVDRPEELPEALTREGAYLIHRPLSLREQLPLGDLAWSESSFTLDDPPILHRALSLERLPALTRPDFLMGVQFRSASPFRIVATFVATDRERLTERLIRKRNIAHAQAGGVVRDVAANVAFSEYERVLETMLTHDQCVFSTSLTVIVQGADHVALDHATRELKDGFSDVGAALTTETGRQLGAYLATLPGNGARAPKTHQLVTNNAADLVPTFYPSKGDEEPQLLFETRQSTLRAVSHLPSRTRSNNNTLVFGSSGSGKSFSVSCALEQACLIEGSPLLIIDVQGPELSSYRVLAEALGGSYTALTASDDVSFNPFFAHDDVDDDAMRYMSDLVALMALPDIERRADRALAKEVARICIARAYEATAGRATPLLSEVVAELERCAPKEPEYALLSREMFLKLRAWTTDPTRARLVDRPSRFKAAGHMQVFDLFGLEKDKELATVLLLAVSFHIWSTIRKHPREMSKFVVFDECWKFLTDDTASAIVAELFRTGRKWNASTWAITQSLSDFLASPIHSAVLQNAALTLLLQHAGDHDKVAGLLSLNARQLSLFKQLKFKKGLFAEMLLVERGTGDASVLKLRPTPFDLWLNTTDPVDVGFRDRVRSERRCSLVDAIRFCAANYPNGAPRAGAERKDRSA